MNRKIQSKRRYFVSFIIATIIFVIIFFLSYSLSYLEFQRISNFQGSTAYSIFEDKLDYSLFNKGVCSNESFKKISEDLGFQGKIIDDLEKKFGKNNENVLFRKKFYTLIELEHFEFLNLLKDNCNLQKEVIFFFYSNEDKDILESERVGDILNVVSTKRDVIIYSFDINLESSLVGNLKLKYGIEQSPTILIDEKIKINDIESIDDILKYLN